MYVAKFDKFRYNVTKVLNCFNLHSEEKYWRPKEMKNSINIPNYVQLIEYTFIALKVLGGSGKNNEINDKLAEFGIGVREVKDYEIDEDFFSKI